MNLIKLKLNIIIKVTYVAIQQKSKLKLTHFGITSITIIVIDVIPKFYYCDQPFHAESYLFRFV